MADGRAPAPYNVKTTFRQEIQRGEIAEIYPPNGRLHDCSKSMLREFHPPPDRDSACPWERTPALRRARLPPLGRWATVGVKFLH